MTWVASKQRVNNPAYVFIDKKSADFEISLGLGVLYNRFIYFRNQYYSKSWYLIQDLFLQSQEVEVNLGRGGGPQLSVLSLGNANKQGWVSGDERPTAAQLEHDAYMRGLLSRDG